MSIILINFFVLEKILSSFLSINKNKYLLGRYFFIWFNLKLKKINNIKHILISGFSLATYGLISFYFNEAFPYPGNDFTVTLLLFNMRSASFVDISSIPFLFNFSVLHPETITSIRSVFFLGEFPL